MSSMRRISRLAAILLTFCLLTTACTRTVYETYELKPNEYLMGEDGTSGTAYTPDGTTAHLTQEDIQAMNNGNAYMVFGNDGYLSFLYGKYYEGKITDHEDAVASIQGLASLLGLGYGCEFFAKYGEKDEDGYTYYTFHQRFGDSTVQFATLRVIVDPSGYTAGLSCSFIPNIGISDKIQGITPEQAVEIVKATYPNEELIYYPEATKQVAVAFNYVTYNAYAVFTNNPYMTSSFDMAYYEHFVGLDGTFMYSLPVASMVTENDDSFQASAYFEGLEQTTYSGYVRLYEGSLKHIEVPIAYNPSDGLYYLCDVEREIIVADHRSVYYEGVLRSSPRSSGLVRLRSFCSASRKLL
jgi:hypothetical protein